MTADDVRDIKKMLDLGMTHAEIARITGRGSGTVHRVSDGHYDSLLNPGAEAAAKANDGVSENMIRNELSNVREQQQTTRQLIHDIAADTTLENIYEAIVANNDMLFQIATLLINQYDPKHTESNNVANYHRGAIKTAHINAS